MDCYCDFCKNLRERNRLRSMPEYQDCSIRIDGHWLNLIWIPTPTFVRAFNTSIAVQDATGRIMAMAFVQAKNVLIEQGLIHQKSDGTIEQI